MNPPRDRCPRCAQHLADSHTAERRDHQLVAGYQCRCGHAWTTSWHTDTLHVARGGRA